MLVPVGGLLLHHGTPFVGVSNLINRVWNTAAGPLPHHCAAFIYADYFGSEALIIEFRLHVLQSKHFHGQRCHPDSRAVGGGGELKGKVN